MVQWQTREDNIVIFMYDSRAEPSFGLLKWFHCYCSHGVHAGPAIDQPRQYVSIITRVIFHISWIVLWYRQLIIVLKWANVQFVWEVWIISLSSLQSLLYMWCSHSSKPCQHVCVLPEDSSGHLRRHSQTGLSPLLQAVWTVRQHQSLTLSDKCQSLGWH